MWRVNYIFTIGNKLIVDFRLIFHSILWLHYFIIIVSNK